MRNQIRADRWLLYCGCAFFFITGASLWETIVFTSAWTSGAPESLASLVPPYGLDPVPFWTVFHTLSEIVLVLAVIFNWPIKERRKILIGVVVGYAIIRGWTLLYFAPKFLEFQKLHYVARIDGALTEKTLRWRHLNFIRMALVVLLNAFMLWFTAKSSIPAKRDAQGR